MVAAGTAGHLPDGPTNSSRLRGVVGCRWHPTGHTGNQLGRPMFSSRQYQADMMMVAVVGAVCTGSGLYGKHGSCKSRVWSDFESEGTGGASVPADTPVHYTIYRAAGLSLLPLTAMTKNCQVDYDLQLWFFLGRQIKSSNNSSRFGWSGRQCQTHTD